MPERQKKIKTVLNDVLIVAKQNKTGIRMARKLERLLKPHVQSIHFDRSTALRLRQRGLSVKRFDGDLVITVGGDGTLLWTAHQTHLPILPVKIEGHGFLCTCTFKELTENLQRLLRGDYQIVEKMRLQCYKETRSIFHKILHKPYPPAFNEIVFGRKRPSKILKMEFNIDNTIIDFSGDGLLVSTPTGSTAYNASVGGPIIDPDIDAMSIVALNPFFSRIKPKVVPSSKKIEVLVREGECALIIDGHGGDYVKENTKFIIEKGPPLKVVHLIHKNFYEKYRNEFLR